MKEKADLILLICHYNNLDGLYQSIKSINEEFKVDILVVDDGSLQKPDITYLKSIYKQGDITLELLPENKGVGIATNHGLKKIMELQYLLTGRLDCGDLVYKDKFKKQLRFLDQNQNIKLLGTWANMVDMDGATIFVLKHPTSYKEIQKKIHLNSTFVNSSTIYYTEILKSVGLFPEKYQRNGEDYAFFFNVVKKHQCANLPEVLLDYEVNPNSLSTKGRKEQVRARIEIMKEHFRLGFYPIYGLLRSYILLYISRDITNFFKKHFVK